MVVNDYNSTDRILKVLSNTASRIEEEGKGSINIYIHELEIGKQEILQKEQQMENQKSNNHENDFNEPHKSKTKTPFNIKKKKFPEDNSKIDASRIRS